MDEGIIAIDIQDGYDKFNDNVLTASRPHTINEDALLNNESQAQAEGNDCLKRFVAQPDLTEIGKTGNSLML
jgi:hypothetical protein